MDEKVILMILEKIYRKVFSNESLIITREMSATHVDEWTSLNHMILISEIEEAFSIKFRLKDLNKMHNTGDLIDIIISKL